MALHPLLDLAGHIVCKDAYSSENSGAPSLVTAGGTGDGTKVLGQAIDRYSGTAMANSCVLSTQYHASLQATETLSMAYELQESDDGSSWDTAEAIEASTVKATGGSGGSKERGVDSHTVSLIGRKRYIRFNATPDLSAGGTDTASFSGIAVLGGFDQTPV